jgi:hypothetical protein
VEIGTLGTIIGCIGCCIDCIGCIGCIGGWGEKGEPIPIGEKGIGRRERSNSIGRRSMDRHSTEPNWSDRKMQFSGNSAR